MNKNDALGNRMKGYEQVSQNKLTRRVPAILRLDGKSFHTYTKGFAKPWDKDFFNAMMETTKFVCENIQGAKLGYTQSDEISILITDYDNIDTDAWFDYKVQKMTSIAASLATAKFNDIMRDVLVKKGFTHKGFAFFDCRIANYPKDDVANYFIWRQKDATRNSIQGLGQANFTHKELQNVSCDKIQDKLFVEKQINWNDCLTWQKRGGCLIKQPQDIGEGVMRNKWVIDLEIPIFTQDRNYIEKWVLL